MILSLLPLSKQGSLFPCPQNIISTNVVIFSECFTIAIKPLIYYND